MNQKQIDSMIERIHEVNEQAGFSSEITYDVNGEILIVSIVDDQSFHPYEGLDPEITTNEEHLEAAWQWEEANPFHLISFIRFPGNFITYLYALDEAGEH